MLACRPATQSSWATWRPARSAAEAIESAWRTPVDEKLVPREKSVPVWWKVLLVEPCLPGQAPLQLAQVGHGPGGREPVDQIGPHAVGREQDRRLLGRRRRGGGDRRRGRSGGGEQRTQDGKDEEEGGDTTGEA